MKKFALLAPILLAVAMAPAAPQDSFTATPEKVLVKATDKDASLEIDLATNLPDKAVVTLMARMAQYEYAYSHNYFVYLPPDYTAGTNLKTTAAASGGKVKALRMSLPTNGLYRFEIRFDPADQQYGPLIRKKMGVDKYGLLSLHERTITVGATSKVFDEIIADSNACKKLMDQCLETLDKLVKLGEDETDEEALAKKAIPLVQKLAESEGGFTGRIDKTLLNGTYRYASQVLASVAIAGQYLKDMVKKKKAEKASGVGSGSGSGKTPGEGPVDPGFDPGGSGTGNPEDPDAPVDAAGHEEAKEKGFMDIPSPLGGKMSFDSLRNQIIRADQVRVREAFLWIIRFTRVAEESIFAASESARKGGAKDAALATLKEQTLALKEIEDAVTKMYKTEELFAEWAKLGGGDKFEDVPAKLSAYLTAVRAEIEAGGMPADETDDMKKQRKELEAILDAFDKKAMGKKPGANP